MHYQKRIVVEGVAEMDEKQLGEILIELITLVGFWRSVFGVSFIVGILTIPKMIDKFIDGWRTKKKVALENLKLQSYKEELSLFFQQSKENTDVMRTSMRMFHDTLEKMQVSVSINKFELLKESFLGLNRTFIDIIKFRLLTHFENPHLDTVSNLKNEIKLYFVDKILNKLIHFIISDNAFVDNVKNAGFTIISSFIEVCLQVFHEEGLEGVKKYIESEEGLNKLNTDIAHLLTQEYSRVVVNDVYTNYLKGAGG